MGLKSESRHVPPGSSHSRHALTWLGGSPATSLPRRALPWPGAPRQALYPRSLPHTPKSSSTLCPFFEWPFPAPYVSPTPLLRPSLNVYSSKKPLPNVLITRSTNICCASPVLSVSETENSSECDTQRHTEGSHGSQKMSARKQRGSPRRHRP